jgi:hypothetical protein
MKITRTQLKKLIKEELDGGQSLLKEAQRKRIRMELMTPMSRSDADFFAEMLINEGVGEYLTGPGSVEYSRDMTPEGIPAAISQLVGGKGVSGIFEIVGELLVWLPDFIPNAVQIMPLIGSEEKDIGWIVKGLRVGARLFGAPSKVVGTVLIKASEIIKGLHPDKQKQLEDMLKDPSAPPAR